MKNLTLLILMTAGLNSYQSHANSTEKYFIGKYEYIIPSSIRKWTDDDNSFNEFAGHVPDKKIPLTKTIKGYKTYCFSQAGVFLSDMLYNSEKVIFRTFDFCQEPMVNLILSESKKLTKPNFSHGLKLVKVSPKQYQSLAYDGLLKYSPPKKKPLIVHKGGFGGFKGGIPHCQLADREKSPRIFVASVYAGSVLKIP